MVFAPRAGAACAEPPVEEVRGDGIAGAAARAAFCACANGDAISEPSDNKLENVKNRVALFMPASLLLMRNPAPRLLSHIIAPFGVFFIGPAGTGTAQLVSIPLRLRVIGMPCTFFSFPFPDRRDVL